jgi:hypothetical protein
LQVPTVSFRVTEAQKKELEARSEGNVSDYVKGVLFREFEHQDALHTILEKLDSQPTNGAPAAKAIVELDPSARAILIELLLLMRLTVKPDNKREAQSEVERIGYQAWDSGEEKGGRYGR